MANEIYCVVNFEAIDGEAIGDRFILPYSPNFFIGQKLLLSAIISNDYKNEWAGEVIEMCEKVEIVDIRQVFEIKYGESMSYHHYINVRVEKKGSELNKSAVACNALPDGRT